MRTILAFLMVAGAAVASDFVVYEQATGKIVSYDKRYEIPQSALTADGNGFTVPWNTKVMGLLSTTNNPDGLTNIVQLAEKTIVNPSDQAADISQMEDKRLRAILGALVEVINLRLPAAQKIKTDELKAAIKARQQE